MRLEIYRGGCWRALFGCSLCRRDRERLVGTWTWIPAFPLAGLRAGAGEVSRNIPSGVPRPERSPLVARCIAGLREGPVMKVPKLVLRECPRSS